jgi:outer membrane protein assembly factor BamA
MKAAKHYIAFCCLCFQALFVFSQEPVSSDTATNTNAVIGSITLIGNKITQDRIIFRELTFHQGDAVDTLLLEKIFKRSEENLLNTSLFNSVRITWVMEGDRINVFIIMAERWYIFPLPIFEIAERNFNVWWETKDFSRAIYGAVLNWNNFRGRNEVLAVSGRFGYTQRVSFYYSIPYINRKQRGGLTFGLAYSRNHQSSVNTVNNKILYYKNENLFSKKELGGSIAYSYRPDLYHQHVIEAGYRHADVLDSVILLNNDYFSPGQTSIDYSILRYFFKTDHRDIAVYPLRGYYIDFEIVKNGFSFLNDDIDLAYITVHGKKFWQLSKRFFFGSGITTKYTSGTNVPYYLSKGLGYGRDFLRGYEYYVMDGQDYALLKSNIKFELLPKKEVHAGFIPLTKFSTIPFSFYLNLYADAGYVKDQLFDEYNPLTNAWQFGYGAGIDFVTYYDLVFRFEYSFNKLGESGFFLHFTSPI